MTKRELAAEVERLRTEVALLREVQAAHVCPSLACTCGSTAMPTACPRHGTVWINNPVNLCGAAAGVPTTYILEPSNLPLTFWQNAGCAGAAGVPQIMTFNVPA